MNWEWVVRIFFFFVCLLCLHCRCLHKWICWDKLHDITFNWFSKHICIFPIYTVHTWMCWKIVARWKNNKQFSFFSADLILYALLCVAYIMNMTMIWSILSQFFLCGCCGINSDNNSKCDDRNRREEKKWEVLS